MTILPSSKEWNLLVARARYSCTSRRMTGRRPSRQRVVGPCRTFGSSSRVWRSRTRTKTRRTRKTRKTKRKKSTGRAPASERVAVLPDAVRATVGGDVAKAALAAAAVAADAGRPAAAAAVVAAAAAAAGVAAGAAAAAGAAVVGGGAGAGARDVEGVRPPVAPGSERKRTARMKLREG